MDTNPALEQIFNDLKGEINQIIADFWNKLNQELQSASADAAPVGPKYKTLPWFQHGVRGFLNKLWHGDHPENPSWKNVQRENAQTHLKLQEYAEIRAQIEAFVTESVGVQSLVAGLTDAIMKAVNTSFQKAYAAGFERSAPNPQAQQTSPEPAAEAPAAPAAPEPEANQPKEVPAEAPTAAANQAVKTNKPRKKLAAIKPADAPAPTPKMELDAQDIQDTALKISISNDANDIYSALKSVGIPVRKGSVPPSAVPNIVRIVHYMSANGDKDLHKNDWLKLETYSNFLFLKIPSASLESAIHQIGVELQDQRVKTKGDLTGVAASGGDPFDARESVKQYKKLLREGNRSKVHILAAKNLSPQERTKFFKGCLSS
jgi:hypothetical protein